MAEHKLQLSELSDNSFYLGSVILHADDNKLNIIDGQQRLTTLAFMGLLNNHP